MADQAAAERNSWSDNFQRWAVGKGLRWSLIAKFMKTRVAQAAATIPVIGYALLWSEEVKKYMVLQHSLGGGLWFSITGRLLLIYFGALLLTTAWAVYGIWCPPLIKRMTDVGDYLSNELQTNNNIEFGRIRKLVRAYLHNDSQTVHEVKWVKGLAPVTLTSEISSRTLHKAFHNLEQKATSIEHRSVVLQAWYLSNDGKSFLPQVIAAACAALGTTLVAIPSIEVFFMVVMRVLLPAIGF
jgi:hypothetical protein